MVFLRLGAKLGKKWASPRANERNERLNAKLDSWSARHRLWSCAFVAVVAVGFAWLVSVKYDGATIGEVALWWSSVLVPIGVIGEWIRSARVKRRNGAKPR